MMREGDDSAPGAYWVKDIKYPNLVNVYEILSETEH